MPLKKEKKTLTKFEVGIEEIILITIILLNVFDMLKILSPEWDYVKKIISWTALGMIFYKINLTKIFCGYENKKIDLILLIGYFSLIIKNFISYAFVAIHEESNLLTPLYRIIIDNFVQINIFSIYVGIILLAIASIYFSLKLGVKKPSILYHLHETDKSEKKDEKNKYKNKLQNENKIENNKEYLNEIKHIKKFFSFFIVSSLFFVGVFNLIMEWLAISIDAPLLVSGLAIYFFLIFKNRDKFKVGTFLNKFGNFGEKFYENILEHLKYKKSLVLVVGGILTLHMFTDMFNYIWAYIFNLFDPLYHSIINTEKISLITLYLDNIFNLSITESIVIFLIYLLNIIGIIFLLGYSTYLWYAMYKKKKIHQNKYLNSILITSIIFTIFHPLFSFKLISNSGIYGIKIYTNMISLNNLFFSILISILMLMFLFSNKAKLNNFFDKFLIVTSQIFFLYYVLMFFYSICTYYIITIINFVEMANFILFMFFTLLFVSNILFYFVGIFGFEHHIYDYLTDYHKLKHPQKDKK